jgi:hypothetical protein
MARASSAVIRPKSSAFSSFPAAPNAIACGNTVTPFSRIAAPRSKSAAKISGRYELLCNLFSNSAATSG